MEWKIPAKRVLILSIGLVLGTLAVGVYLWRVPPAPPEYVPGPTSVHTVYEPKWKTRVKPVQRLVPVGAVIEFFPNPELAKASKIPDAPDNAIAFGEVPKHKGKSTVFATLKMGADNVMRGGLEYRQEAVPFWGWEREFHAGAFYGVAGKNVAEVQGRVRFLRTGPVSWEAQGRVGMERDGGQFNGAVLVGAEF